jgi:hypothetical protein
MTMSPVIERPRDELAAVVPAKVRLSCLAAPSFSVLQQNHHTPGKAEYDELTLKVLRERIHLQGFGQVGL